MKCFKIILMSVIIFSLIGLTACAAQPKAAEHQDDNANAFIVSPRGDYVHKITDEYSIINTDNGIYELVKGDTVILSGTFYSYSIISNECIAIHYMDLQYTLDSNYRTIKYNSIDYSVLEDEFIVYYFNTEKTERYENWAAFNAANDTYKRSFENWYYNGYLSENIPLTDNSYLRDMGEYRGQILFINNQPILEGVIDEYTFVDNNTLKVAFKDGELDFGKEFATANSALSYDKFAARKKYRLFGIVFIRLNYASTLLIDTQTGTISEESGD